MFLFYIIYTDESLVRAALTPTSELQQLASIYVHNHYKDFADQSPNSRIEKLSIATKKILWDGYVLESVSYGEEYLDYSMFNQLWNALNPYCVVRGFQPIIGKCDTCAEIESLKTNCKDKAVLEAAKQCHHLHKGGMITPERLA